MKNDTLEICRCLEPLTVRFREFEDIGFRFHWVGSFYHIDVVLFVEGCVITLLGWIYA